MGNRLYPSWEQLDSLNNPLTEGERHLLLFLDTNLPKDKFWTKEKKLTDYNGWLIFAQPFLNGSRPDILIFNPFVGVVIYEVKDWNLENYKWDKDHYGSTSLFVHDKRSRYAVKSPIRQVEHYKEKIISQLVPIIGELIDKDKRSYGLIKTALYFHKVNTNDAQDFFGARIKDFKHFPVFGYDSLHYSKLNEIVPDIHISRSNYWDRKWNEELIFWFNPPTTASNRAYF
ncbi:NERD domain-containing protein [Pontibacter russatus]|uniref:NERD domain-containing protein n=1 Tax=Pontibacter russatus TaxID=2694929 RepID=UPI00137AAD63|nr:NERD domain-containing protein [Pontibacter russatus]